MTLRAPSQKRDLDPEWMLDPEQYFRRGWHSSLVLGDYIYINGGDVLWQENGTIYETGVNSSYSLPISQSWTPQIVRLNRIDKGDAPSFNRGNLWPNADNRTIFAFNGDISGAIELSHDNQPTSAQLWRLTPNGNGGATWDLFGKADGLIQSVAAAGTWANGSAYLLGGIQNTHSSSSILAGTLSADGLVVYDMASQTWDKQTIIPFAPTGWSQEAQLHHLAGVADSQLLLAMGGLTSQASAQQTGRTVVPYSTVSIYNMQTKDWYNQSTTGDIPDGRGSACHVGIQGDNGTYEIFIHGGGSHDALNVQNQQNIDLDQVYVLSIPSFSWHKTSYTPKDARATHTCQVAGNRQMIAYGGVPPSLAPAYYSADPWPQGLGIFDLSDMVWKDSYDAGAAAYSTPSLIKDYIFQNGSYPSQWDNDTLKQLIMGQGTTSSTSSPSSASSNGDKEKHQSNIGATVGGVVGGVSGVLIILVITWFLLRRRKRNRQHQASHLRQELDAHHRPEMGTLANSQELSSSGAKHELPIRVISELP